MESALARRDSTAAVTEPGFTHTETAWQRQRRGDLAGAIEALERQLARAPEDIGAWLGLAVALRRSGQSDRALVCLQRAMRLAPRDACVWSHAGSLWNELGQTRQALRAHRRAVELDPWRIDLRLHCARAMREEQLFDEAERLLEQCLQREPARADLLHEHALICLHTGRWREAWPAWEARLRLDPLPAWARRSPRWAGERIGGKRVALVEEQGVGSSLWAARYIALLALRGAQLTLVIDRRLHPLLAALPVRLLGPDEAGLEHEQFDFHAPLLSLPWLVDPCGTTIPEPAAIVIDDASHARAALAVSESPELRIGLALPREPVPELSRLLELAQLPGVRLFALDRWSEPGTGAPAPHLGEAAAVVDALDLVITTDQAIAHVAGSLHTPVLTLLEFTPHWCWGLSGDRTPWYPGMRLLRQASAGDWSGVAGEVRRLVSTWARVRQRECTLSPSQVPLR